MKRTIVIEVETERTLEFRHRQELAAWCPSCQQTVPVGSLAGATHFTFPESAQMGVNLEGSVNSPLLVCLTSLLNHIENPEGEN